MVKDGYKIYSALNSDDARHLIGKEVEFSDKGKKWSKYFLEKIDPESYYPFRTHKWHGFIFIREKIAELNPLTYPQVDEKVHEKLQISGNMKNLCGLETKTIDLLCLKKTQNPYTTGVFDDLPQNIEEPHCDDEPPCFQVGDEVFDIRNPSKIRTITNILRKISEFLIEVDGTYYYAKEGKLYEDDEIPSLHHKGTKIIIKKAVPKMYPWVNIYKGSEGTAVLSKAQHPTRAEALSNRESGHICTIQLKPEE